jgi:hypothetical protein
MIVNCPACTTLFRYEAVAGAMAVHAQCSRCDESFDLDPTKRAYSIVAETDTVAHRAPGGAEHLRGDAEPWNPPDGMKLGDFEYEPDIEAGGDPATTAPASGNSSVGEWLTALFLGAVGGGSGYYLAVMQKADMATFVAGGSAIGLVLGWAVIRWMAREA